MLPMQSKYQILFLMLKKRLYQGRKISKEEDSRNGKTGDFIDETPSWNILCIH